MNQNHEFDIRIDDPAWQKLPDLAEVTNNTISIALKKGRGDDAKCGLTIVYANNTAVGKLNHKWRDKNQPTNILSFPAPANEKTETGNRYLGDLILAYEVIASEADQQGKSLETHLCHLIAHGVLHLLGFDHQDDVSANEMESHEISIMAKLGFGNPYGVITTNRLTKQPAIS